MFLLNETIKRIKNKVSAFTIQNVSIKYRNQITGMDKKELFTIQNVSIK